MFSFLIKWLIQIAVLVFVIRTFVGFSAASYRVIIIAALAIFLLSAFRFRLSVLNVSGNNRKHRSQKRFDDVIDVEAEVMNKSKEGNK